MLPEPPRIILAPYPRWRRELRAYIRGPITLTACAGLGALLGSGLGVIVVELLGIAPW